MKSLSRVQLLATPWTAASQAPPSMGFSRQEYWSGVPLPSPLLTLIPDYSSEALPFTCSWDSAPSAELLVENPGSFPASWNYSRDGNNNHSEDDCS